ncbi:MAG TPA: HlyD family secretion protein [Patescibacteria group bacterium]|nr:HlyD family secretion protein [Patescibacteria group bacterium]
MKVMINKFLRVGLTLAVVAVGGVAALGLWHHYMMSPWTRDGRVRAEVVSVAPEVPGTVVEVRVTDNQMIHKGDVLFVIDPERYKLAVAQAEASASSRREDMRVAVSKSDRRARLSDLTASTEEKEQFQGSAGVAAATFNMAAAQVNIAKLDLARTVVRSPVNGYVTNLRLRVGDYAPVGQPAVVVIDSDSFWVAGYFEETKLAGIHPGDAAAIQLMGYPTPLTGHVESMSRGITDQNGLSSGDGLANVNPVFTWVRLAQRIPIRIHIDAVPPSVELAAGMTCTVHIGGIQGFRDDLHWVAGFYREAMAQS